MPDGNVIVIIALGGILYFGGLGVVKGVKKVVHKTKCVLVHGAPSCVKAKK